MRQRCEGTKNDGTPCQQWTRDECRFCDDHNVRKAVSFDAVASHTAAQLPVAQQNNTSVQQQIATNEQTLTALASQRYALTEQNEKLRHSMCDHTFVRFEHWEGLESGYSVATYYWECAKCKYVCNSHRE